MERIIKIAICDDEAIHRDDLVKILEAYETTEHIIELFEYSDGLSLIDSHKKQAYNIMFLDIEMNGISGLETGHKIRMIDKNVIIIYLTGYERYVFESFKIEPFDYIVKPIDSDKINAVLSRAIEKYNEQYFIIEFKWKERLYALRTFEIVHIESELRHIIFNTENNRYKCIGQLDEYEKLLSSYGFLRCHKSFLINMNYIKSIENKSIITTLNYSVDMSARQKQNCLNNFSNFIAKHKV
ncbi:MAG: LytTR family DNA-binding domain-containing protein [Oscillospiraceae bacterium]|jgi:DNA-binding LytR/AlgR family response regulator|nr:LytTR family DNA-binding domain-containing protein [Oscillospiraceae bacterium]